MFNIAAAGVPKEAKEVFIYVTVQTGADSSGSCDVKIALWTTDGARQYKKYIYGHLYAKDCWACNSENMEFPLASDLTLFASFSGTTAPNLLGCRFYVIGYRL